MPDAWLERRIFTAEAGEGAATTLKLAAGGGG
jgi:hypothetical protein